MHAWKLFATIEKQETVCDISVCLGTAMIMPHILNPSWNVVGFRPNIGVLKIAQQCPSLCTVSYADPPPKIHDLKKKTRRRPPAMLLRYAFAPRIALRALPQPTLIVGQYWMPIPGQCSMLIDSRLNLMVLHRF